MDTTFYIYVFALYKYFYYFIIMYRKHTILLQFISLNLTGFLFLLKVYES